MDSASLTSLTPLLDGVDKWVELAEILPVLVSLELVLSADNAVALASITKGLDDAELQRKALNIGIGIALSLRVLLIFMAQWVLDFWPIKLFGSIYLLGLAYRKISIPILEDAQNQPIVSKKVNSLLKIILLISLTDLAFSIDSVTAAVAISDQTFLVITGAIIGVVALRFTSGLFVKWLEIYNRLENAGYFAVGLIGFKLLLEIAFPLLEIPEYLEFLLMFLIFIWGFSEKKQS